MSDNGQFLFGRDAKKNENNIEAELTRAKVKAKPGYFIFLVILLNLIIALIKNYSLVIKVSYAIWDFAFFCILIQELR